MNLTGRYRIDSIDGQSSGSPSIEFAEDGAVFGKVVNNFRGQWSLEADELTVGPLAATLMMGLPEAMAHEWRLMEVLGAPLRVALHAPGEDDVVTLTGGPHTIVLHREPTHPAAD
jgi:heat shock protein HslJ